MPIPKAEFLKYPFSGIKSLILEGFAKGSIVIIFLQFMMNYPARDKRMIEANRKTKPAVFVAENVKCLLACDFGRTVLDDFALPEYTVTSQVCLASGLGVPRTVNGL